MIAPPPPKLSDLPRGTQLHAGLGVSTIHADIDFETYSPAGFVWYEKTNKFHPPRGASKKGLPVVGLAVYSQHPDAEVLSCAYDLKDGKGKRLWTPDMPMPLDLCGYVLNGGILEAWNSAFEYWIWENVCTWRYGWPHIKLKQFRCAMSKAKAHALPGHLADAGNVLNITNKKDKDGKRLLEKFSWPRNPTKANPAWRIRPQDDPADAQRLYEYNLRDIEAEAEISSLVPDLSPDELEFWLIDQAINVRGVAMDKEAIHACMEIRDQAHAKYNRELFLITDGWVHSASEVQKLRMWLAAQGVIVDSLDEDTLKELLKRPFPPNIKRALQIRDLIGSAAVAKLFTMSNQLSRNDRLHDLFAYHSARTGRAAGRGVQPQNLPNSGMTVSKCDRCQKHFTGWVCAWCGHGESKRVEWNPQAVEEALQVISTCSLDAVEYYFGDAIGTISGCIRGMFVASPGCDLICSDYSAIEAVVLAALAGEEWRLEVFRTHGKIYEMSASTISGVPFDEFLLYKASTGQHHPLRKTIGKVAELACFTHDTQVLTQRGYVDIKGVLISDKLWDGIEWVEHDGVIEKGLRAVIKLDGIEVTPNHPISLGDSWQEANLLALNENTLSQALAIGSASLPSLLSKTKKKYGFNVLAVRKIIPLFFAIFAKENLLDVINALRKNLKKPIPNYTPVMRMSSLTSSTAAGWSIGCEPRSLDATAQITNNLKTTAHGGLPFVTNGVKTLRNFYSMSLRLKAGTIRVLKWIEWIVTEITNPETSDSLLDQITNSINENSAISKKKSETLKTVYDIVNAGKRNRFTIKTDSGHLIVHNSGYAGWVGAWKAFGADEFFNDQEIKGSILAWRKASPAIVEFWGGQERNWQPELFGLEGAAVQAILSPGTKFSYRSISYIVNRDVLYCQLPSGRYITYHKPQLRPSERRAGTYAISFEGWNTNPKYGRTGWVRMDTYSGKLCENVVQAVARDILAHAIVKLEKAGYPVVLHVHDEIVSEVKQGYGTVEDFEKIMSDLPAWANGWPIKASGGWRAKRYAK